MGQANISLTRKQVKRALKSQRGAQAQLARELGVSEVSISVVLKGSSTSARIMAAATERAAAILDGGAA